MDIIYQKRVDIEQRFYLLIFLVIAISTIYLIISFALSIFQSTSNSNIINPINAKIPFLLIVAAISFLSIIIPLYIFRRYIKPFKILMLTSSTIKFYDELSKKEINFNWLDIKELNFSRELIDKSLVYSIEIITKSDDKSYKVTGLSALDLFKLGTNIKFVDVLNSYKIATNMFDEISDYLASPEGKVTNRDIILSFFITWVFLLFFALFTEIHRKVSIELILGLIIFINLFMLIFFYQTYMTNSYKSKYLQLKLSSYYFKNSEKES